MLLLKKIDPIVAPRFGKQHPLKIQEIKPTQRSTGKGVYHIDMEFKQPITPCIARFLMENAPENGDIPKIIGVNGFQFQCKTHLFRLTGSGARRVRTFIERLKKNSISRNTVIRESAIRQLECFQGRFSKFLLP